MSRVSRGILLGIGVALGCGALVLGTLNRQPVEIDLYFGERLVMPLWIVAVLCFALGWIVPSLIGGWRWFRRHREVTRLKRRVQALEDEVVSLRNIPLDIEGRPVKGERPLKEARRTEFQQPIPAQTMVPTLEVLPRRRPRMLPTPDSVPVADEAELDSEVPPER